MLTNQQMIDGVLRKRANGMKAAKPHARMVEHVAAGGRIVLPYYGSVRIFKSADHFAVHWNGLYLKRGKARDYVFLHTVHLVR